MLSNFLGAKISQSKRDWLWLLNFFNAYLNNTMVSRIKMKKGIGEFVHKKNS